jgi:hypothetical protein
MVNVMVPSVPSEQVVGVVLILIISRSWAFREPRDAARETNSSMEYLYAFIGIQIHAVTKQYCNKLLLVAKIRLMFTDHRKNRGSGYN